MTDADDEGLLEAVARAIAQADEQNGAGPYEQRMTMGKHAVGALYDEARAAIIAMRQIQTCNDSDKTLSKELRNIAEKHGLMFADDDTVQNAADRIEAQDKEIKELRRERDAWIEVCQHASICMTCALGAPEPYGCTDCLNTGWNEGKPQEVYEALDRAKCAEAGLVEALEVLAPFIDVPPEGKCFCADGYYECSYVDYDAVDAAKTFLAKHGK